MTLLSEGRYMEIRLIFGTSTVLDDPMTDSSKVTYGQVMYTGWIRWASG